MKKNWFFLLFSFLPRPLLLLSLKVNSAPHSTIWKRNIYNLKSSKKGEYKFGEIKIKLIKQSMNLKLLKLFTKKEWSRGFLNKLSWYLLTTKSKKKTNFEKKIWTNIFFQLSLYALVYRIGVKIILQNSRWVYEYCLKDLWRLIVKENRIIVEQRISVYRKRLGV